MIAFNINFLHMSSSIGRRLTLKTNFGTEDPAEQIVHSNTFTQILLAKVDYIHCLISEQETIFEASCNWVGESKYLSKMLNGELVRCPEAGIEACRIETSYRFLFKEIWFGPRGNLTLFTKDGNTPDVEWDNATKGPFSLKLILFGKYFWDEASNLVVLSKPFTNDLSRPN